VPAFGTKALHCAVQLWYIMHYTLLLCWVLCCTAVGFYSSHTTVLLGAVLYSFGMWCCTYYRFADQN
jgi:hypothetical protein